MALTKVTNSMMDSAPASVLDYGADPTGATDATLAIQTAINENKNVHIPAGTYRCDSSILIQSTGTNRKVVTMTAATTLKRFSSFSANTGPIIELLGDYGVFDGGFGTLVTENNSARGVICLGQRDQNTLSSGNGLFWTFCNCHVQCKSFAGTTPAEGDAIGVFIPSAQPTKGSNYANYYGTVSNVRVFNATIAYYLTDMVNAHTFVNCAVEFFWYYAWKLNGAYGNSVYGGFINGCYRNGGVAVYLGNQTLPLAPFASSHQSIYNNFFGLTTELYTTGNYGVQIPAGVGGLDSQHNFVQINWNSVGTAFIDDTATKNNTVSTGAGVFSFGDNIELSDSTLSNIKLLKIGAASTANHTIARTSAPGATVLNVQNLNTSAAVAYALDVSWNTPLIGYGGAIIGAYHIPTAAYRFKVLDSGNCQNTNNVYGAISDIKYKDVVGSVASQWDDVKFLASKLTKYTLKSDPDKQVHMGWIAQEIEARCPGLVFETPDVDRVETTDADGNVSVAHTPKGTSTKGVKYSIAELKAFKALGEALERIEQLEKAISELRR